MTPEIDAEALGRLIGQTIREALAPLRERIARIEERLDRLNTTEARGHDDDR